MGFFSIFTGAVGLIKAGFSAVTGLRKYSKKKARQEALEHFGYDKGLADPPDKFDLEVTEERIVGELSAQIRSLSKQISPKTASIDKNILPQPPEEVKEKALSLLGKLEEIKKAGKELPVSVELDEGIALIAAGEYEKGGRLIDDYLARMETAWERLKEKRDEEFALAYKARGDAEYYKPYYIEALEFYKKALEIRPDDPETLNSAGVCALDIDLFEEARVFIEKAVNIELNRKGAKNENYLSYLNNFGYLLYVQGEYKEALKIINTAMNIAENYPNLGLENITPIYNNLGILMNATGDYKGALKIHKKNLKINTKIYGKFNSFVATDYNNLGIASKNLGDLNGALEYYEQSLDISKIIYGELHPKVATTLDNIGLIYFSKGDYKIALKYHYKALDNFRRFFGDTHTHVATCYNNIALSLKENKNYEDALVNFNKALEILERLLDQNHPNVAITLYNIGELYGIIGDKEKSLSSFLKAFKIYLKVYGKNHCDSIESREKIKLLGGDPEAVEREVLEEIKREGEKKKE
ncbi:MAG: tetratricopeptide repeat protein [Candidatus Zixiibacteriota bacterium]|nr:MAG: tetratricopeptide repeat protein [candidate division Zixibacteria bacterium]